MKITILTPHGKMNFSMEADKASELVHMAFRYADETEPVLADPEEAEEQPKPQRTKVKPHRRVDSLFGDFRTQRQEESEQEEYRGFMLIKCEHCGKIKGFCARDSISKYTCDCGEKTELHDLKVAFPRCKCGSSYKYMTNLTDKKIEYSCLNCGNLIDLEFNDHRNKYFTV
jgi:hypothetical protein